MIIRKKIDQMFNKLQPTIHNYNTVILQVGANDLSRGSTVKTLLRKYQQLTSDNQFPGALLRTNYLTDLNQRAHLLNTQLQSLSYSFSSDSQGQQSPFKTCQN